MTTTPHTAQVVASQPGRAPYAATTFGSLYAHEWFQFLFNAWPVDDSVLITALQPATEQHQFRSACLQVRAPPDGQANADELHLLAVLHWDPIKQ